MPKREEADSGLRAGFITEEEAIRQRREQEVRAAFETLHFPPAAPDVKEKETATDSPSPDEFLKNLPGSSTIEIQGISGKVIPGVIKVIKKPQAAAPEKTGKAKTEQSEATVPSTTPDVHAPAAAVSSADSSSGAPDAAAKQTVPVEPAAASRIEKEPVPAPVTTVSRQPGDSVPAAKAEGDQKKTVSGADVSSAAEAGKRVISEEKASHPAAAREENPAASAKISDSIGAKTVSSAAAPDRKIMHVPAEPAARTGERDASVPAARRNVSDTSVPAPRKRESGYAAAGGRRGSAPVSDRRILSEAPQTPTPVQPKPSYDQRPVRPADRRISIAERSLPITEQVSRPDRRPAPRDRVREGSPSSGAPASREWRPLRPQRGSYLGQDRDMPGRDYRPSGAPSSSGRDYRPSGSSASSGRSFQPRGDRGPRPAPSQGQQRMAPRYPRQDRPAPFAPPADFQENEEETSQRSSTRARRSQRSRNKERTEKLRDMQNRREQREVLERNENLRRSRKKEDTARPKRPAAALTKVILPEHLTVKEFAEALKKTTADIIMKLMQLGVMATINQEIDYDTASIVASDFGISCEKFVEVTEEDILFDESEDREEDLVTRPPVVVVMGHVDHGKTTILDYFRKSSMTAAEAGGITQHIGAYMVPVPVRDRIITFLDTPGHEAFTTLRARGAQVTDIAVLVVAADDGVMPQTVEAINHARASGTEIIVAINKIDKREADIDRVKRELSNYELMDSSWGGNTTIVPVSAKKGTNMDELLDMILLTADVLDLKANPNRQAKGTVIEARLDQSRGPVATVLIQRGTLRTGDAIVVGNTDGHVRMMYNDHGTETREAGPSVPVEIIGLGDVPEGGDILYQVKNEKIARELVAKRKEEERASTLRQSSRMSLDSLFGHMSDKDEAIDLNIIVKADTQGSVEAIRQSMVGLSSDKISVHVIHGAVGAITETDVRLAEVADAIIIGFNVRPTSGATSIAEVAHVDIHTYRVIYEAIDDVSKAMSGMLKPQMKEVVSGKLQVREVFHVSNIGTIAGCYVESGRVNRKDNARLLRDGVVVFETKIASLRRFKDDVREVTSGYECGIGLENYNDIKVGDEVEVYVMEEAHDAEN